MGAESPRLPTRTKSVAFTDEKLVVDTDGRVTMVPTPSAEETNAFQHGLPANDSQDGAAQLDDDVGLDLTKLKKKKKPKKDIEEEDAVDENGEEKAEGGEDGIDLTLKKKKKKKVIKADGDDFAAKLQALDLENDEIAGEKPSKDQQEGSWEEGTGIFEHDAAELIQYNLLLTRFFAQLSQRNPDHASSGAKSYKIPPPQCMREGNKKTVFANIAEIAKRMKRSDEHVIAYLFSELGTTGSVDGASRLVIRGRFQSKQIEAVLRKYIIDYVTCKTCRSPDTTLTKGENRLYFVTCTSCQSRRSVSAIKTGFSAQIGKRRKQKV